VVALLSEEVLSLNHSMQGDMILVFQSWREEHAHKVFLLMWLTQIHHMRDIFMLKVRSVIGTDMVYVLDSDFSV
jgi:hypothetical protein